jgi:hypothetical protein
MLSFGDRLALLFRWRRMVHRAVVVRERPMDNFKSRSLLQKVHEWWSGHGR